MGATRVAFHEYPLLPPRPLGDRQRRLQSPTSRPVPACVGRAWRAAAPLAPLASALVFSRRLLVRPCRLFVSKKTVLPKKNSLSPYTKASPHLQLTQQRACNSHAAVLAACCSNADMQFVCLLLRARDAARPSRPQGRPIPAGGTQVAPHTRIPPQCSFSDPLGVRHRPATFTGCFRALGAVAYFSSTPVGGPRSL